jgi:hypothetical protein
MGKELEKVNAEKVFLKVHGVDREIKFSFSAWAILEKEYDGLKNLAKLQKEVEERPFNTLPHLLYVGLVDKTPIVNGKDVFEITEENILNDYGLADIEYISDIFNRAIYGSLPTETKKAVKEAK